MSYPNQRHIARQNPLFLPVYLHALRDQERSLMKEHKKKGEKERKSTPKGLENVEHRSYRHIQVGGGKSFLDNEKDTKATITSPSRGEGGGAPMSCMAVVV